MKGTGSSEKKHWKQSFCMLPFCTVIIKSVAKLPLKSKKALLIFKIGPVLFIFWRVLSDLPDIPLLAKSREELPFFLLMYCSLDIQKDSYRASARKAAFPLSYCIL